MTASRSFGIGERTFDEYVWYVIKLIWEVHNVSNTSLMNLLIKYSDTTFLSTQIKFKVIGSKEGEKDKIIT